jgi:RNase P protein component
LREIFRKNRAGIPPGLQVVVNVRPSAAGATFSDFAEDYLSTLGRGLSRLKGGR